MIQLARHVLSNGLGQEASRDVGELDNCVVRRLIKVGGFPQALSVCGGPDLKRLSLFSGPPQIMGIIAGMERL